MGLIRRGCIEDREEVGVNPPDTILAEGAWGVALAMPEGPAIAPKRGIDLWRSIPLYVSLARVTARGRPHLEAILGPEPHLGVVFILGKAPLIATDPVVASHQVNLIAEGVVGRETAEPTLVAHVVVGEVG